MKFTGSRFQDTLGAIKEENEDDDTTLAEFFNIELIDRITDEFLKDYNIHTLLKDVKRFNTPIVVPYKFNNATYEGTIYNYRTGYPTTNNQLTLRLSHDGFRYSKVGPEHVIDRVRHRNHQGWLILNSSFLKNMKTIKKLQNLLEVDIQFKYHQALKRIDIEFYKRTDSLTCMLAITFEKGYPKYENKKEYFINIH